MRALFVTGTDTDVGKTYVTALLCRYLKSLGKDVAYFKAAASGEAALERSDAGYVHAVAGLTQDRETLVSYLYAEPLSPHLCGRLTGRFVSPEKVVRDFKAVSAAHEFTLMEGSGGIVCPIVYEKGQKLLLEDIITALKLDTLLVARAGLGTINHTVLTVSYLRTRGIGIKGIILNHFEEGNVMHADNLCMIEELTGVPVLATVAGNASALSERPALRELFTA